MRTTAIWAVLAAIAGQANALQMDWVTVGDAGNAADRRIMNDQTTGYGGVDYTYLMGKYEVTNAQYCAFLNAVARSDLNGLYNTKMGATSDELGGIARSGSPGAYSYLVRPNRERRPVNYVSWYDTLRFANWMHNGQPVGAQDAFSTEDGAYDLSQGAGVTRKPGARVFLPSEHEWYKAAYYRGGGTQAGFWMFATRIDEYQPPDHGPRAEPAPGTDLFRGSANYFAGSFIDPVYYTIEVGSYTAKPSTSAYGTFDQNGNLAEWTEGVWGVSSSRVLRGGNFLTGYMNLEAAVRGCSSPTSETEGYGFRIAALPEPATSVGIAAALVGLLLRRRLRSRGMCLST